MSKNYFEEEDYNFDDLDDGQDNSEIERFVKKNNKKAKNNSKQKKMKVNGRDYN